MSSTVYGLYNGPLGNSQIGVKRNDYVGVALNYNLDSYFNLNHHIGTRAVMNLGEYPYGLGNPSSTSASGI